MAKRQVTSIESIAAEAGRLFGTTESHAKRWLKQRGVLLEALHLVREQASSLIAQISSSETTKVLKDSVKTGTKKRRMSAATRAKMAASQKKRWAKKAKAAAK